MKRLAAIENFGSMNVLCSDKTGTLTEGEVRVHAALDPQRQSEREGLALRLSQRGERNRIRQPDRRSDPAVAASRTPTDWRKAR